MANLVICDIVDGVASITLNRPDYGNDLASTLGQALIEVVRKITISFSCIKHLVDGVATRSRGDQHALEQGYMLASAHSQDGKDDVAAFMEKRRPHFTAT